jgi:hypothetical protein
MVVRHDAQGALAVGQQGHAWLCGQLGRAWGNPRFGPVTPAEEVALGAEQHDVGMSEWDLDPIRDAATGLPQSFLEMDSAVNVTLWRAGPRRLVSQCRYAALLAVMHGRRLYERHDLSTAPAAQADAVRAFLEEARALETTLLASLRADPLTAPFAGPELVARNSRLVWTWDTISLALLLDWAPLTLTAVPTADGGSVDVAMAHAGPLRATLAPWPFASPALTLRCEGRRLTHPFSTQEALAVGLAAAPWETLILDLVPGSPDA